MSKNRLRVQANERVDLTDFSSITGSNLLDNLEQLFGEYICSPTRTRMWIIDGFGMTNPAAKQLQVDLGRAILAQRRDGALKYGILATAGDSEKIVDLNTYTPGTYGIYIRFEEVQDSYQARAFWNPAGAGSEYVQTISTQYSANWAVGVESSSPGSEWMKIGEVDQATMTITDQRNFYFEGPISTYASGWSADGGGSANDRDPDRATYGVKDLQMALASMRQCVEDLKGRGLRRWWERSIGGMNIGFDDDPLEGILAIGDEDHRLRLDTIDPTILEMGVASDQSYFFGPNAVYPLKDSWSDLGKTAKRWANIWANQITLKATGTALTFYDDGGAADEKRWMLAAGLGDFIMVAGSDDGLSVEEIFRITRTGYLLNADWFSFKMNTMISKDTPWFMLQHTEGDANEKNWKFEAVASGGYGELNLLSLNDAEDNSYYALKIIRDGYLPIIIQTEVNEILPSADGNCSLGRNDLRFFAMFSDWLSLSTGAGEGVGSHFVPDSAGSWDLGFYNRAWKEIFCENVKAGGDEGGTNDFTTMTGVHTSGGSTTKAIYGTASSTANAGWLKFYLDTTAIWIPYWLTA